MVVWKRGDVQAAAFECAGSCACLIEKESAITALRSIDCFPELIANSPFDSFPAMKRRRSRHHAECL